MKLALNDNNLKEKACKIYQKIKYGRCIFSYWNKDIIQKCLGNKYNKISICTSIIVAYLLTINDPTSIKKSIIN